MSAKSRSTLASELAVAVNDNTSGDVTPADVRGVITDANDSAVNKTDEVSAFALTLLDDTTASAARTTLGLGTLATQSGTFSGTSSGTNTGDQTITLTGDVTGSGTGSFAATVANNAVSLAKMADIATDTLIGRATAGTGDPEAITCTAAGRALLDDADAAAQRTTLGAAATSHTHALGDLTASGASSGQVATWNGSAWAPATPGAGSSAVVVNFGMSLSMNPADSTTYYIGPTNMRVVFTHASIRVPKTGTVTKYWVRVACTSAVGSSETVNYYLRLNDTTDFGNYTTTWDANYSETTSGTLSQAVTAGDELAVKVVTPAWVTNPTAVYVNGWILIE